MITVKATLSSIKLVLLPHQTKLFFQFTSTPFKTVSPFLVMATIPGFPSFANGVVQHLTSMALGNKPSCATTFSRGCGSWMLSIRRHDRGAGRKAICHLYTYHQWIPIYSLSVIAFYLFSMPHFVPFGVIRSTVELFKKFADYGQGNAVTRYSCIVSKPDNAILSAYAHSVQDTITSTCNGTIPASLLSATLVVRYLSSMEVEKVP